MRSEALDRLTEAGWQQLHEYGIRTIIDLRNDDERRASPSPRQFLKDISVIDLPLDGIEDVSFWNWFEGDQRFGATPLYYLPHLKRMPERSARVLSAIANAPPGGVLFHCVGGRDRTGLISLLLLAMLGVPGAHIIEDYELSDVRLSNRYKALNKPDPSAAIKKYLADRGTSAGQLILTLLATVDPSAHLRLGGLTDAEMTLLRQRLLTGDS